MLRQINLLRKNLGRLAAIAGLLGVYLSEPARAEWQPNGDDELLFDIRSGAYRVGNGVRGYQTDSGVCVDLGDVIMALDLPVRLDKKSRRATGWLFEESRTFTLDRELNAVQIMNKTEQLAANEVRDIPSGWCVDTATLSRWLNVAVKPDMSNALLVITADRKLPFELAEERKDRAGAIRATPKFDLSKLPKVDDPYKTWRTPSVDVVASLDARKDVGAEMGVGGRYEAYASGEILGASFDARLSSDNHGTPDTLRLRAYRTDPKAELLGPLHATHIAVGDVATISTSLVVPNTVGRGGIITNRPVDRPDNFDRTSFRGELPDGWDAELYRNDQLIAYAQSRSDGRYEFLDVPLHYGQNKIEIILYGPQGQIRRESRNIPVGVASIPPRQTYYWAVVQDAGKDLINFGSSAQPAYRGWRGGLGLERGINARTSVGLNLFSAQVRGQREYYYEGAINRSIGPMLIELSGAGNSHGGTALSAQLLGQFGKTMISAKSVLLSRKFRSPHYDGDLRRLSGISLDRSFNMLGQTVPVSLSLNQKLRLNGDSSIEGGARFSFDLRRINASVDAIWRQKKRSAGADPPDELDLGVRLSGSLAGMRLRGEAKFGLMNDAGFRESKITAEWRAGERADWRAELGYDAKGRRGVAAFGYSRHFEKFALSGHVQGATDGSVSAGVSLSFSLGPNPYGGFNISSEKLAAGGAAYATVFEDRNADGIRQADEPVQPGVELTTGMNAAGKPTDKFGQTVLPNLAPFEPVLIGIDASSLPDPFIQPANSGLVVTPRPGIPVLLELPLVPAGEISGTLVRSGGNSLSGLALELIDKNGQVVKRARSEYDGFFLFESVPYGKYSLRVEALAAGIVRVNPQIEKMAELKAKQSTVDLGIVAVQGQIQIALAEGDVTSPQ